jgi:hypothetical protein
MCYGSSGVPFSSWKPTDCSSALSWWYASDLLLHGMFMNWSCQHGSLIATSECSGSTDEPVCEKEKLTRLWLPSMCNWDVWSFDPIFINYMDSHSCSSLRETFADPLTESKKMNWSWEIPARTSNNPTLTDKQYPNGVLATSLEQNVAYQLLPKSHHINATLLKNPSTETLVYTDGHRFLTKDAFWFLWTSTRIMIAVMNCDQVA